MSTLKMQGGRLSMNGGKLTCVCCCPTDLPIVEYDSISASKTKCGHAHYAAASDQPGYDLGKRYLERVTVCEGSYSQLNEGTGIGGDCDPNPDRCCAHTIQSETFNWSGSTSMIYARSTCSLTYPTTGGGTRVFSVTQSCSARLDWPGSECESGFSEVYEETDIGPCGNPSQHLLNFGVEDREYTADYTPTTLTESWSGSFVLDTRKDDFACPAAGNFFDDSLAATATTTLSVEYTDEMLEEDVDAAAGEYDDDWDDTAGALLWRASTGLTLSKRLSRWRVPLPSDLVSGRTYDLIYIVRFTPAVGAAVDGEEQTKTTTYDGSATHTTPEDVPDPTENGTNTIILIRWECPTP